MVRSEREKQYAMQERGKRESEKEERDKRELRSKIEREGRGEVREN